MRGKIFGMVLVVMFAVGIAGAEELYAPLFKAPLPEDAVIQPASPEIPAEYARFLGVWEGNWDWKDLPNRLIVMSIKSASDGKYEADVYYAWGRVDRTDDITANKRLTGVFRKDGSLFLKWKTSEGSMIEVTYEPKRNPLKLDGYYSRDGNTPPSRITVKKVK
ncbi:MAG: hypothetical protein QMD44_10900 [Thermodesulfovibrionales bacterium]|jgi:hypothetical protein|nr:hypothetical protein [Thermodesulfovibrionales bacterium]